MKLETALEINKPPSEVYAFLLDEENLSLWIDGFVRLERISGEDGAIGSISKHIYNEKGRVIERIEEITANVEDELLEGILKGDRLNILIRNQLKPIGEGHTKLLVEVEVQPKSLFYKLFLPFFRGGMLKRQESDLQRLKEVVEKLTD